MTAKKNETPEEKAARLEKQRQKMAERRRSETTEERAIRLEKQRRCMEASRRAAGVKPRKTLTPEERAEARRVYKARWLEKKRAEKAKKQESYQERLEDARAALPANGSWLREWCAARGLDSKTAQRRSGLSYATWQELWSGGKTIPGLALMAGKLLGMTQEEVQHLGVIVSRTAWERVGEARARDHQQPEYFDMRWWERLDDYPADKVRDKLWETQTFKLPPSGEPRICAYCGRQYLSTRTMSRYCSMVCSGAAKRERTGKGPMYTGT